MIHTSSIRLQPLYRAVQLALAISLVGGPATATAQAVFQLASLDGDNGFRLDGVTNGDYSGHAVTGIGDINGDTLDDLLIGAFFANGAAGASYVVFGTSNGFNAEIELATLNGDNGFRLDGVAAFDFSGFSVSTAGDINNDNLDDLMIGARNVNDTAGASYVVFGASTFASAINLSTLDGTNGFRLDGAAAGDLSGFSVSAAGDVNGDTLDDLIIGARNVNGTAGASYVVFGASTFASAINLSTLDGTNGFRLDGAAAGDLSGLSVSAAGDVNGDTLDDLIVGAPNANGTAGASYVVFGASTFAAAINLSTLDAMNGFRLDGISPNDVSGSSVSTAGDINGDGLDDVIIGARYAADSSGQSYVVLGHNLPFSSSISLASLNGTNGFRLDGVNNYDLSGFSVSAAGDINGDGLDDLLIGAYGTDHNGGDSGSSYVVYGRENTFESVINLATLDVNNGFRLDGEAFSHSGTAVAAAGDVNGDGLDDVIIGAPNSNNYAGSSYVVFGIRSAIFSDGFED